MRADPHTVPIHWSARSPALPAVGAIARGEVAVATLAALLRLDDDALGALSGVRAQETVVILASSEGAELPWADGIVYLGVDPEAPALLLPARLRPSVHPQLLERAILSKMPPESAPVALSLPSGSLFGLACARPLSRPKLQETLASIAARIQPRGGRL